MTLTFDMRSSDVNQDTPRYIRQLIPKYEWNPSMGLGGDSEHTNKQTDRQTNRGATGINNIDMRYKTLPRLCHVPAPACGYGR